jgi:hypothetical protein
MDDQHRQELLRSRAAYATAKLAFANTIVIAQGAGETDEEIAHVTGYTVPMIRAGADSAPCFVPRPRRTWRKVWQWRSLAHPSTESIVAPPRSTTSGTRGRSASTRSRR